MATLKPDANIVEQTIEVTVRRANGSVEQHGVVSYYHRRFYRRWAWKAKQLLKRAIAWAAS